MGLKSSNYFVKDENWYFTSSTTYGSAAPSNETKIICPESGDGRRFGSGGLLTAKDGLYLVGANNLEGTGYKHYLFNLANEHLRTFAITAFGSIDMGYGLIGFGDPDNSRFVFYNYYSSSVKFYIYRPRSTIGDFGSGRLSIRNERIYIGTHEDNTLGGNGYGYVMVYDLNGNFISEVVPITSGPSNSNASATGAEGVAWSSDGYVYDTDILGPDRNLGAMGNIGTKNGGMGIIVDYDRDGYSLTSYNLNRYGSGSMTDGGTIFSPKSYREGQLFTANYNAGIGRGNVNHYNNDFIRLRTFTASDVQNYDYFGRCIDTHNGKVFVGMRDDNNSNGSNAGAVYIYDISRNFSPFGIQDTGGH